MELPQDDDLLYIAKLGLITPLPKIWRKPYKNRKKEIFYINLAANSRQVEHPCDEYAKFMFQIEKQNKLDKLAKDQAKIVQKKIKNINEVLFGK